MANITITPNMNLPSPVPGVDPGPDWSVNINAAFYAIDSHNHSAGYGVQIQPNGLNINTNLPINGNALTLTGAIQFNEVGSYGSSHSLYDISGNLYWNNGGSTPVQITSGSTVNAGAGSISGLPSGTASASYSAATFTFNSATNTPANLVIGPITIGTNTVSPNTVTIAPSGSQSANYNLTLPVALPASTSFLTSDSSGNLATVVADGTGDVVLQTGATLSGANIVSSTLNTATLANAITLTGTMSSSGGALAGTFAAGSATFNNGTFVDAVINGGTLAGTFAAGSATFDNGTFVDVVINGSGSIDQTTIGATTPAAGTFTTVTTTANIVVGTTSSLGGGGAGANQGFKVAVMGGTLANNTEATLTISAATHIFSVSGTYDYGGDYNFIIGIGSPAGTIGISNGATAANQIILLNNAIGSTATYRMIIIYQ